MDHCTINVTKVLNGYTMNFSYEEEGKYKDDVYIAKSAAQLLKMVKNAVNLVDKEVNKNAD